MQILFRFLFLTFLSACASAPQTKALLENSEALSPAHQILNVPFIQQSENYCGPATLAIVGNYWGVNLSLETLGPMMFTPEKKGTLESDFISAARRLGLFAIPVSSLKNILIEVSHDYPVIVLENLGSSANPIWHYAVLHGYDLSTEALNFHSGFDQNLKLELSQFERVWKAANYWALVVVKPGVLPFTSTLLENLNAANALERIGKNYEANLSYQSISQKWPESAAALFGLGNTYFALKKYSDSMKTFKAASKLAPTSGAIWNNLGEAYLKLHRKKLARETFQAAQKNTSPAP